MKGIVTICQNKRIALPYIYGKYVFPKMRDKFRGELKLFHVFHDVHDSRHHLASNKMGDEQLRMVREFIEDGRYPFASVVRHKKTSVEWAALPSVKIAAELSLYQEKADFHLWMEDDAIICDLDCDTWAITLGSGDVGLYRDTNEKHMINCAYFLSTPEYDKRIYRLFQEYRHGVSIPCNQGKWSNFSSKASLIEHIFWRAARKPILLDAVKAYRHHPYVNHRKTCADVANWLKHTIPDITPADLELLKKDFKD